MRKLVFLSVLALVVVGCDTLGGGTRETRVSITGPGPIKCIVIQGGKEVTQDCPDTVTPAPVIVPPIIPPPTE